MRSFHSAKSVVMDCPPWMRRIASPSSGAMQLLGICFWVKAVERAGVQTGGEESAGVAMNADFIQEPRQGAGVDAPQQRPQLYPDGNRRIARQFVPRLQERLMNEC